MFRRIWRAASSGAPLAAAVFAARPKQSGIAAGPGTSLAHGLTEYRD